jgi:hypothetical protein
VEIKIRRKKTRLFPKLFFTWTLDEEPAEITRARDNAKGLKHRGMPISNIYVDPVKTNPTSEFYGSQTMKAIIVGYLIIKVQNHILI